MSIRIPTFDVLLSAPTDDDPEATTEHRVRVLNGDQLRAELEAPKHRLTLQDQPMHMTTMWIWAAMVRTGEVVDDFRTFKPRVLAYDQVKKTDEGEEPTTADPTHRGAGTD